MNHQICEITNMNDTDGCEKMVNPIRKRAIEGLKTGDSFNYKRKFKKNEIGKFGDMTRDYNPVHYDLRWAKEKGF